MGRGITYLCPARMVMKRYTYREFLDYMMWASGEVMKEGLDMHRLGGVFVEDLKGVSLKNFDLSMGKRINEAMTHNFPQRIKGIYICNPPFSGLIKVLMRIARLLVKKKIIDRVRIITDFSQLHELIDKSQLVSAFGGDLEFQIDDIMMPPEETKTKDIEVEVIPELGEEPTKTTHEVSPLQ